MREWNDAELLSAYANRQSEAAFGVLVERHIALVYSAALRQTRNPQLAEEATQATFTILAQKARELARRTTLSGWLCCTAHFVARNALKTEARRYYREKEARMQSLESSGETWQQLAPLLDEAVAGLNETDRSAVVLRFFERKSLDEVGNILGIAPDAAQKRVSRALEKLRHFFARRGVHSTTGTIAESISAHSIEAAPAALAKMVALAAVAQGGASTSVSILTLKALKTMAWTKAKTAVVASTVALLAAGTTIVTLKACLRAPAPRTTAATSSIKGQLIGRRELVDAGNTTLEAAWESRYWARAMGNYNAVIAATDPKAVPVAKAWMGEKATFHRRSQAEFASFGGIRISARKDLAPDKVELKSWFAFENQPQTKIVTMVRVNGAWICRETRAYDTNWDPGSHPEAVQ